MPKKDLSRIEKVYVLSDFDGTVTIEDAMIAMLNEFSDEDWYQLVRRWERREMTLRDSLRAMYEMTHATKGEVLEFVDREVQVRKGFPEFVQWCRDNGVNFEIVSEGLDVVIERTLAKYRVKAAVRTNTMLFEGARVKVEFNETPPVCRHSDGEICGTCKESRVVDLQKEGYTVVYVGDGKTDVRPGRVADIVFGRRALARKFHEEGKVFHPFENYVTVKDGLARILGLR